MDRLTDKCWRMQKCPMWEHLGNMKMNDEVYRSRLRDCLLRLAEYEDAEEQGMLLWLPCKPGDTVYEIVHPGCRDCAVIDHERYKSCHVQYGEFCGKEEIRAIPFSPGCLDYMGGLVFLTREEAEAKLKEGAPHEF